MAKNKEGNEQEAGFMVKVATFIVDKRNLFFLIFAIAVAFSMISKNWVGVENSLTAYLPENSETRLGLALMEEEYITYGSAEIMVTNITYEAAEDLADSIEALDYVSMVQFDGSDVHYNDFSALYNITFPYPEDDDTCLECLSALEGRLSNYDYYVSTDLGDQTSETISSEMQVITVFVAIVVGLVLLFTCDSFAEIPVLVFTFLVSAALSDGTNFIFGTISFVSDSVTIVLQLALSVDYAVIFMNKYKVERANMDARSADIIALSKAIPEISASSLTTIGGLIAMLFMQFQIGPDMGIVLIKAIFLSLLTVFTLMPGFIMLFDEAIQKTGHKSFIPKIDFVGKFAYQTRRVMPILFVLLIIFGYIYSSQCPYVYGYSLITAHKQSDQDKVDELMSSTFEQLNMVAINVPAGDYDTESRLTDELLERDYVDSVVGLANTEAMNGRMLTEKLTAREFAELLDLDSEIGSVLYAAYAVDDEDYAKVVNGVNDFSVPFIDMFLFLHKEVEEGYVTLDSDQQDTIDTAYNSIMVARNQLQGENYDRMLIYLTLPEEGDETFAFLDELHDIGHKYYGDDAQIVLTGNSTSQYDLKTSFDRDNKIVSLVSMFAVLIVLLFTFKSAGMPILLLVVIEGCIWLNFSYPKLSGNYLFFMSYLIVSSIQMGANIDYAIVVSSRFQEVKKEMEPQEAIIDTMNYSFPTIITSGTMMAMAGILIGFLTSERCISSIGEALGRGTIISIIAVLFALPQILLVGNKIIYRTSFDVNMSLPVQQRTFTNVVRLDGFVNGRINGNFVGVVHGTLLGEVDVRVSTKPELNITRANGRRRIEEIDPKEAEGEAFDGEEVQSEEETSGGREVKSGEGSNEE